MKIKTFFLFLLVSQIIPIFAQTPDWLTRLPFTDDAFWGVGKGISEEQAIILAKQEILMQLSSHVKSAIVIKEQSNGNIESINEKMEVFFESNSLRGAELEETFQDNGTIWVLMKYCDECGDLLMNTAINLNEENLNTDPGQLMETITAGTISSSLMVERRLQELKLQDFNSSDISVTFRDNDVIIRLMNFLPNQSVLTERQRNGMATLSSTLFMELQDLNYQSLSIVGHANPEGKVNEEAELADLSRNRAEVLAGFLRGAGLNVDSVNWRGGSELIGNRSTIVGRGMNRRVEIIVRLGE